MNSKHLLCSLCLIIQVEITSASEASKSSMIALTPDDQQLLVVNTDSNSISVVDVTAAPELEIEIPVGRFPQTVHSDLKGQFAYSVNRDDDNLTVLDLQVQESIGCIPVNDEPFGIVIGEKYAYVSNQGSDSISVVHLDSQQPLLEIEVGRAPRGLALSGDNTRLFVSHFFSGEISVIDTGLMQVIEVFGTGSTANISQAIVLDEINSKAYLPQTFSNVDNRALLFDNTVFPFVSVIDLQQLTNLRSQRISVDVADTPVGIPIDAVLADTDKLYVVNAGSNDVSVIDLVTNNGISHLEVGDNPRGIAWSPKRKQAYVNNTLAGTVSILDTVDDSLVAEIQVTSIPLSPGVLNGKKLFNNSDRPDLAKDQWISCATCHFDGEHDARTWFFKDGPRNTPSLLGVDETLPMHWSGDLDELHDVESTIRNIQLGTGLTIGDDNCSPACNLAPSNKGRSTDLDDLALYMQSLSFSHNPSRSTGGLLNASQLAGKTLFESAQLGCATCHSPPLYTDTFTHDVGTSTSALETKGRRFDTPSLRGIYKTAPYLHDGSATSLEAVLGSANPEDLHGVTSKLSNVELQNLVSFLKALPFDEPVSNPAACSAPLPLIEKSAALELSINQTSFSRGANFDLAISIAGKGRVDVYAAIRLPDGEFVTVNADQVAADLNQIVKFREARDLGPGVKHQISDTIIPQSVTLGTYTAYGIVVESGADVLNQDNWISVDTQEFVIE